MKYREAYGNVQIIVDDLICVGLEPKQIRFPKSKKSRIRKKWRKRPENYRWVESHKMIRHGQKVFMSSKTFDRFKNWVDSAINPYQKG